MRNSSNGGSNPKIMNLLFRVIISWENSRVGGWNQDNFIEFKWSGGPRYSLALAIWTPCLCVHSRNPVLTCAIWPWHFLWHSRTEIPDVPNTTRLADVELCGNSCKFFCASALRRARFSTKNHTARNQSVDWWIIGFAFDSCERDYASGICFSLRIG